MRDSKRGTIEDAGIRFGVNVKQYSSVDQAVEVIDLNLKPHSGTFTLKDVEGDGLSHILEQAFRYGGGETKAMFVPTAGWTMLLERIEDLGWQWQGHLLVGPEGALVPILYSPPNVGHLDVVFVVDPTITFG